MLISSFIDHLANSIWLCLLTVLFVCFLCVLICYFSGRLVEIAYNGLQRWLLKRSSRNRLLLSLINIALIINCRTHRRLSHFFNRTIFSRYNQSRRFHFSTSILNDEAKPAALSIILFTIISFSLHFSLRYRFAIADSFGTIVNSHIASNFLEFAKANYLSIITCIVIVVIVGKHLKEKYIDKIVLEEQDEDLKKILKFHKELYKLIANLRRSLCANIGCALQLPKVKGTLCSLTVAIEALCPKFEYDYSKKSFVVRNGGDIPRPFWGGDYFEIQKQIETIQSKYHDYFSSSPFYDSSAIIKYYPKIDDLEIKFYVQQYGVQDLICKEHIASLNSKILTRISEIKQESHSQETVIEKLNVFLNNENDFFIDSMMNSIEYVILLDDYLRGFGKAFKLRAKRGGLPIPDIADEVRNS